MIDKIVLKIKRRENGFYAFLYDTAKRLRSFNVPTIKVIHLPLYYLQYSLRELVATGVQALWSIPLFKARCEKVGTNLRLPNGIPYIDGNHLRIIIGDNVSISRSTIGSSKVLDEPLLKIGNNSGIGYGTVISVAREVVIGDDCLIAPGCLIMDSDDHPINPAKRLMREPVSKEHILPVKIGNNVWIGSNCVILKGVTIGDNSIIAANSVVTREVQSNCIYAGYPARPTRRDIDAE